MGYDIKIDTPMDFMGVTDHSEYVGVTKEANTPGSPVSKLPRRSPYPEGSQQLGGDQKVFTYLVHMLQRAAGEGVHEPRSGGSIWKENVRSPTRTIIPASSPRSVPTSGLPCPNNRNLHRNIFFRDCDKVPAMPYSALDSKHPEDLWNWMDTQRKAGNELLAISHNANLSDGWMYPD